MNVYKRPLFKRQGGSIRVPVPTPPVAMRATPRRMPGSNRRGIGQLMADVAGKINMESAPGNPNRMGQGLGNIMMARQGGAVQKLANGGSLTEQYYEENRPFFEKILGTSQEDRDAAQRRFFSEQAMTGGLNLARGAGGQGNLASQLATVILPAVAGYSNLQAGFDAADDQVNLAAFQSADARANAEREQKLKSDAKLAELQEQGRIKREEQEYGFQLKDRELNQKYIYDMTVKNLENKYKDKPFEAFAAFGPDGTQLGIINAKDTSQSFEDQLGLGEDYPEEIKYTKIPDAPAAKDPEYNVLVDSKGNIKSGAFNFNDAADLRAMQERMSATGFIPLGVDDAVAGVRPSAPSASNIKVLSGFKDGSSKTFDTSTPAGSTAYQAAIIIPGVYEADLEPPGSLQMTPAFASGFLATDDIRTGVETGEISNEDLAITNRAIQMNTRPRPVSRINPQTALPETIYVPTTLEEPWEDAIIAGYNRGLNITVPDYLKDRLGTPPSETTPPVSEVTTPPVSEVIPEVSLDGTSQSVPDGSVVSPVATDFTLADQEVIDEIPDATIGAVDSTFVDWNPADSFGSQAQADAFINRTVPKVINFFTGLEYGAGSPEEIRAESALNSINAFILETLFSSGADGTNRMGRDERELFYDLVPGPGEPAERAAGKYEDFVREFTQRIDNKKTELAQPQGSFTAKQKIRQQIVALESRRQQIAEVAAAIRSGISGRGPVSETDLQGMQDQYIRGPAVRN